MSKAKELIEQLNKIPNRSMTNLEEGLGRKLIDWQDKCQDLKAKNARLRKDAKEDLKEVERLRSLASQLCEERNQALSDGDTEDKGKDAPPSPLEAAAKKAAKTGNQKDLQAYLKLRRDTL